eukprot:GHVR01089363.1.p1 GENE.GHVR01089363.1~~GHVR01089363.1.p1  ORF type:complete len:134 (-),score=13.21 GHVR01089363.1:330-731(-)
MVHNDAVTEPPPAPLTCCTCTMTFIGVMDIARELFPSCKFPHCTCKFEFEENVKNKVRSDVEKDFLGNLLHDYNETPHMGTTTTITTQDKLVDHSEKPSSHMNSPDLVRYSVTREMGIEPRFVSVVNNLYFVL